MAATSNLLTGLQALGFVSFEPFPYSDTQQFGFYQALAQALAGHVARDYGPESLFIRNTLWKKKLPNLSSIYNKSFSDFYERIGQAFLRDLIAAFQYKDWVSILQQHQVPAFDEREVWESLTAAIHVHIVWYEESRGQILTHSLTSSDKESLKVFVSIAQEGPVLYLLGHRDFERSPKPGFPFYSHRAEDADTAPVFDYRLLDAIGAVSDDLSAPELCKVQCEAINSLLELLSHLPSLPTSTHSLFSSIEELYSRCIAMQTEIDAGLMQAVLEKAPRKEEAKAVSNLEHTLYTCSHFPGELLLHAMPNNPHKMHKACLAAYLQQHRGQFTCPVCGHPLPLAMIDAAIGNEALARSQKSFRRKNDTCSCSNRFVPSMMLQLSCGCAICVKCVPKLLSSAKCITCGVELSAKDMDESKKLEVFR